MAQDALDPPPVDEPPPPLDDSGVEPLGSVTIPELYSGQGLYAWTLQFADGSSRVVLASSLYSAVSGKQMDVVLATRGAAFDGIDVPPVLSTLSPSTKQVGAANFTLTINGTGFKASSQILWDGAIVATTFVSATQLTTPVVTAALAVPKLIPVSVQTVGGQLSNVLAFTVTP